MADEKKFIQKATERMKAKGTIGSFGKATQKKIAAGKRAGGKREKKAVFAENMKKIAAKHKHEGKVESHNAIGEHKGRTL